MFEINKNQSLVDLQLEDVHEISTSCYDPRFSHWNPFRKPSSASASASSR